MKSDTAMSPAHALLMVRLYWIFSAVLCFVLIGLGFAMIALFEIPVRSRVGWIGAGVGLATFVILTLAGHVTRLQIYKRHWIGQHVSPTGYLVGNLMLYSFHKTTIAVAMICMLLGGSWWPALLPGLLALILLLATYPHGGPMVDTPPNLGEIDNPFKA